MQVQENVSLKSFSTMRLGGNAAFLCEVAAAEDIPKLVAWAQEKQLPMLMIGDGSNIVWRDEGFNGLILVNHIPGFEVQEVDDTTAYITIGSGENWDNMVAKTVELGYNGLAELSLIPGTAGATPVQNVGAYGREISQTLVTVQAYDTLEQKFVNLQASDCAFGYRTSRFKTTDKGRFLIASITLMLKREKPTPPYYDAVARYLEEHGIKEPNLIDIRTAVIAIRTAKLPDPKVVANNGSFFANPVIDQAKLSEILASNPNIKYWHNDDGSVKLSAAWLIEQAGFKDVHDAETGMATWPTQPLVLVNEDAKNTADLLAFKQKIVDTVATKFNVTLQQEPELLP